MCCPDGEAESHSSNALQTDAHLVHDPAIAFGLPGGSASIPKRECHSRTFKPDACRWRGGGMCGCPPTMLHVSTRPHVSMILTPPVSFVAPKALLDAQTVPSTARGLTSWRAPGS